MTWAYAAKRNMHIQMIMFYFERTKKIYKHMRFVIQVDGMKVMVRIQKNTVKDFVVFFDYATIVSIVHVEAYYL